MKPFAALPVASSAIKPDGDAFTEPAADWQRLKQVYGGVYMTNGGYDKQRAESALTSDQAELVSFDEPFIANPDLPARLRNNAPLNDPDRSRYYGGAEKGYIDYPVCSISL